MSIKNTVSAIQNPAAASSTSREGGASSVTSTSAYRYPAGFSPEAFLPASAINEQRTTAAERKDATQRLLRELSRSSSAPANEASTPAALQPDHPLSRLKGLDLLIDTDTDSDLARDLTTLASSMAKLGDACGTPRDFICPSSPNSVPQSAAPLPAPAAPLSALPSSSLVPSANATPVKAPSPAARSTPQAAKPTVPAVVPAVAVTPSVPAVPAASAVPAAAAAAAAAIVPVVPVAPKASATPHPAATAAVPSSPAAVTPVPAAASTRAADPTAGSMAQLAVPAEANAQSNYRALRDNNNVYRFNDGRTLTFRPDQLKMDDKDPTTLVGTDRNDRFDSSCFAVASGAIRVNPHRLLRYMAGDGDDVVGGGENNDTVWGGRGKDIVLGYEGNDRLYGEEGNDQLRGGDDNDFLDGGSGEDQLLGENGNDVLFGGTGADEMQGGRGDDIYYVDDKGDVVIEQSAAGRDTVISAISYELGSNVEDLTLAEGDKLNGTGNALDNRLQGNSSDNILDGGKGADIMAGGKGNDTYYVDQAGDQVQEQAGEGIDTVNAFISTTLGANVENLTLLDAGKPQRGLVDGRDVLVYGYPHAYDLDYEQGDALPGYTGDCGPTSVANLCRLADLPVTEAQVLQRAIEHGWCNTDGSSASQRGSSNALGQQSMLESFGIRSKIKFGYDEQALANFLKEGRGAIMSVNAGKLWAKPSVLGDGSANHMITVTGVACNAGTGAVEGFYIADSGRGRASDMCRYLSVADFRQVANVQDTFWLHTVDPVKLRQQDLSATGNALDNTLVGNGGNNLIKGGLGNDTLIGQAGNDTYVFSRGDGRDVIFDHDERAGNTDVLQLTDIAQTNLWFSQDGNDLRINVLGSEDQITVKDWFTGGSSGSDNHIERIRTSEGYTLYDSDVAKLVQAMASFAPPAATQTEWVNGQISQDKVLLTMTH